MVPEGHRMPQIWNTNICLSNYIGFYTHVSSPIIRNDRACAPNRAIVNIIGNFCLIMLSVDSMGLALVGGFGKPIWGKEISYPALNIMYVPGTWNISFPEWHISGMEIVPCVITVE